MLVVRPVNEGDLDRLEDLIGDDEIAGMTSIPRDRSGWSARVSASHSAFTATAASTAQRIYFMVMEDQESRAIAGTCAVFTNLGIDNPFYSFKLSEVAVSCRDGSMIDAHYPCLQIQRAFTGYTEVGSLFLRRAYRRSSLAKLLTKSRYLLMAMRPSLFNDNVLSQLRGPQEENGQSPFWNAIGRRFINIPFEEIERYNALNGTQAYALSLPHSPIYLDLLPDSVRQYVSSAHAEGAAARLLLEKEGFVFNGNLDIFDGGATLECPRKSIRAIASSTSAQLASAATPGHPEPISMVVAFGDNSDFRCTLANGVLDPREGTVTLVTPVLRALNARLGDTVIVSPCT